MQPGSSVRIPVLDGFRGLAIVLVLLFHCGGRLQPPNVAESVFHQIVSLGWSGIDLFFVLSGFLITGILCDTRSDSGCFWKFYARRLLRIFPIYYLLIAGYVLVLPRLPQVTVGALSFLEKQEWVVVLRRQPAVRHS